MTRGEGNNPLVSICLPTYNYAHYLPESISSCLNQTYEHIELIITDDASTDNSREVINSFDDPRIRFEENPERLGLVGNWNKALTYVRGDIVKFIFADDYPAEGAVEKFVEAFEDPSVDLVFSSCRQIEAEGKYLYTHQPYPETRHLPGRAEAKRCLLQGNYIGSPSSAAVRASALKRVGDFNELLRFHADQEMWIRVLLNGDGYFLAEPLVSVRIHEGSETRRLERTNQTLIETQKFVEWCLGHQEMRALLSDAEAEEWVARNREQHSPVAASPPSYRARLGRLARRILNLGSAERV